MTNTRGLLKKKAKRYKKFFEKVFIEDKFLWIDETSFYTVFYLKNNRSCGMAFLSSNSNVSNETYRIAFETLVLLYTTTGSINTSGRSRARINTDFFYEMQSFFEKVQRDVTLTTEENENFQVSYEINERNIKLQDRLIKLYGDFKAVMKIKVQQGFTIEDVEYMMDILVEMDYIQYKQLSGHYKAISNYESIYKAVQYNNQLNVLAGNEVKQHIKDMTEAEEQLSQGIKTISHFNNIEKLSKEEHMKLLKEQIKHQQAEANAKIKKEIRFPELDW